MSVAWPFKEAGGGRGCSQHPPVSRHAQCNGYACTLLPLYSITTLLLSSSDSGGIHFPLYSSMIFPFQHWTALPLCCCRRSRQTGRPASTACCPASPTGRRWLAHTLQPTSSLGRPCCLPSPGPRAAPQARICWQVAALGGPGGASHCWCSLYPFTSLLRSCQLVGAASAAPQLPRLPPARCRGCCCRRSRRWQRRRQLHPRRQQQSTVAAC